MPNKRKKDMFSDAFDYFGKKCKENDRLVAKHSCKKPKYWR